MHVYKRGKTYHFKKRIPARLADHPFFSGQGLFYSRSLETDSFRVAEKRALSILSEWAKLESDSPVDRFDAWMKYYQREAERFAIHHKDSSLASSLDEADYRAIMSDEILARPSRDQDLRLNALFHRKDSYATSLKHLANKTTIAKQAVGKSGPKSVIAKIRRGKEWLLSSRGKDDLFLEEISWTLVHEALSNETIMNTPSNTLRGYLYGLRQIWKHAYKLQLVSSRTTPFDEHDIQDTSVGFNPFTIDEVRRMYSAASQNYDLQLAIKIGYSTGARAGEVCDIQRYDSPDVPYPLWAIKFSSRGKTKSSQRLIPIHPKLVPEIPKDFKARWSYKNLIERAFKKVKESSILDPNDALTLRTRRLGFHSFRVMTVNTLVYEAGFSLAVASEYTGHKASRLAAEGAITGYLRDASFDTKLKMANSIPWIFD